jgi:chromosome segregation ATPase
MKIHSDGHRTDAFGTWVSKVDELALGGAAARAQLLAAQSRLAEITEELPEIEITRGRTSARIEELEGRIRQQERRTQLFTLEASIAPQEAELHIADTVFDEVHIRWTAANDAVLQSKRNLDKAESGLQRKREDVVARTTELEGTRNSVGDAESRVAQLQPDIQRLTAQCSAEMKARVDAEEIKISVERATGDVEATRDRLYRFCEEGPSPSATVREEQRLVRRNIEELERHVAARQSEADAAREELDRCRGEYLNVIGSTLHDYRRRAYALADIARARLEIELPTLENEDKSIDEAGIFVRIGFDGKPPTEIGDTAHSGGQQVIAGLILLMAMAETEGDSFFIVDEPFAHLSLDRVDEVGRFLRGSGSQFLITVPTTLDRGQLDPASLLIVLRKKDPQEPFAPRPIVARV